jgi:hypothetical protein
MVEALVHRMWVSNDDLTWHWFCEGLDHDPRGPAKCGAEPDPLNRWKGKKKGQWKYRVNSKRLAAHLICPDCVQAKKREDLAGRAFQILIDPRAALGLKIVCGTCFKTSFSPSDVVNMFCGYCKTRFGNTKDDLPPGYTWKEVWKMYNNLMKL